MKTVIFVLPGNVETAPVEVAEFDTPHYSIRNEIDGDSITVWLPGSNPPPVPVEEGGDE